MTASAEITHLLTQVDLGRRVAADRLMPLVYEDLRGLAARYMRDEAAAVTLEPTALVNEAYLRLVDYDKVRWRTAEPRAERNALD